jgi:ribosomal protein S18 acetylase RimI-like enzyme
MDIRQTLTVGEDRFRVGPWQADARVAVVGLPPDAPTPTVAGVRRCLDRLAEAGYSAAMTSALHPREALPFETAGFAEHDRLRVLAHALTDLDPPRPAVVGLRLRRATDADAEDALAVDRRAFPDEWRIDRAMLAEARAATPVSRFRVAVLDGEVAGYAVTGRGGRQGFLQRLATDPAVAGRGVASALVVDALRWARRHRARRVLVNTQRENRRALDLYLRLGFVPTPTDLVVLSRPVP